MKVILLPLVICLFVITNVYGQLNKPKHYETILKIPLDSLIIREVSQLQKQLELNTYQKKKLKEKVILYYIALRKVDNNADINNSRKNLEWNFAEYQYLKRVERLLNKKKQETAFRLTMLTERKEKRLRKFLEELVLLCHAMFINKNG